MMPAENRNVRLQHDGSSYRNAGIAIAGSSLLGLLAVSMHPVVNNSHTVQEAISQIAAFAAHDAVVHGSLIVLLAVIACGFVAFGDMLGPHRNAVRLGKAAYLSGYAAMTAAMLLDGFVVPAIGKKFAGANAIDMQSAFVALQVIGVFIQVLTKAGIVAISVAFLAWARALQSQASPLAWAGKLVWVGYAVGIVSIGVMLFVNVWLGPTSLVAVFSLHALWNICVAATLLRAAKTVRHDAEWADSKASR